MINAPIPSATTWRRRSIFAACVAACALGCRESRSTGILDFPYGEPIPFPPGPGLSVESVMPSRSATAAPRDGVLSITFHGTLDPSSPEALDVRVFGRWSGVVEVAVEFGADGRSIRAVPARPFAAGERVTVTLVAGSYRGTRGEVGRGHAWSFRTASAPGSLAQRGVATIPVRRPGEPHIRTCGTYAGDLNRDGWSDLVLPNERSADLRIFLNDGAGGYEDFEVVPVPDGADPSTIEGADLDGDGDIDLVVGNASGSLAAVFHGDGAGGMTHVQNLQVGQGVRGVCLIDFENDGDADLVATAFNDNHLAFFRNSGGTFTPAGTMDVGDGEWSCAPGDVNNNGFMDLFVGTRGSNEVITLGSRGDGSFVALEKFLIGEPWMLASGDLDGDGRIDVAAVNGSAALLSLISGAAEGTMSLIEQHALDGFPLSVDAGDLDGDGDLEVVTSDFDSGRFVIFENDGGRFRRHPVELAARTAASCVILHDRDNDGDLDITGIDEIDDLLFLFENHPG